MGTTILKPSALIDCWLTTMNEIKYEFRTEKYRVGAPVLLDNPDRQYRYRSLYGYGPDTVRSINSRQNTRDLGGCPVYSETIIIDCDTKEEATTVDDRLTELEIPFELWLTGNRGCHFHIAIKPMWGTDTIWSQTCWLRDIGVWDVIDTSIYRENGQIRVPGAVHEKTGRTKERIREATSRVQIEVPIRKAPPMPVASVQVEAGTPEARNEYHRNLFYRRNEGGRHTHMFVLWNRGKAAGYPPNEIRDDIRWWNDTFAEPSHTATSVETKLRGFR